MIFMVLQRKCGRKEVVDDKKEDEKPSP